MSSRRSVRQLVVAVLLGVLVGGGLMAVTPAGAEVSSAVATNWKKIWKKNLKPLADRRYYTKSQSDTKYQSKGSYETAGSGYSKAESDAKYAATGSSYSKAESDAKYAPMPGVIRGTFIFVDTSTTFGTTSISFGQTLNAAPTVNLIQPGGVVPAGCVGGSVASPTAQPGNLCVFLRYNSAENLTVNAADLASGSSPFGADLLGSRAAAGYLEFSGSWAVRPSALAPGFVRAPGGSAGSQGPAVNR